MSAKDKSGLRYGTQIHERVLSYENEVLESMFDIRSSDVEDSPVNDRFETVEGMHVVPPLMTGIDMPPKSDFRIDESKFTYGPKQFKNSESDAKTSDIDSCESNSSIETLESVPKPVEFKPKAVSKAKVWSDAHIIKEYESDSDDKYMIKATVEQEIPSSDLINIVKHDNPHQTLKGKGIVDSGCSRHMTGNKAYLVEYQDFNGGPVAFGGSKSQITEFRNRYIIEFCTSKEIKRNYSNARTPQQNGVAEWKNRTLIEAARTMLADSFLPNTFWADVVSTA
nr:putative ribonuclease H-like domain-containing protein [Tanacetum cinerariifolium]